MIKKTILVASISLATIFNACQAQKREPARITEVGIFENKVIRISFDETVFNANIYDNPSTRDFISRLPMTIRMGDIGDKEKYAGFSGGLAHDGELRYQNEPGQLVYWPTGPGIAIYYKVDGKPVRGGIVIMAKIVDKNAIEVLKSSGSQDIKFELTEREQNKNL